MPTKNHPQAIVPTLVLLTALFGFFFFEPASKTSAVKENSLTPVSFRHKVSDQPLYGYVIVIDPGHGGLDPGAHGTFRGKEVYEAPYVMDVARRVVSEVRKRGGITFLTRHNPRMLGADDSPPSQILPLTRDDVFRSDGSQARAGNSGMEQRLATARHAIKQYPRHHVIFVSIHFDAEPANLKGVYVIAPAGEPPRLANALLTSFGKVKRLRKREEKSVWRDYNPLLINGHVRNLYILRSDKNPIKERVLVELGNFGNKDDVWRIRDPKVRHQYAEAITAGLEQLTD